MAHPTSSVPCTVAGDWFLYAQKNHVYCCTQMLDLKRFVTRHDEAVNILAADTDGKLVVSCDRSCDRTTAIVWDPATGEEKRRLCMPELLSTVAWAQNGTVAFGSCGGNVIFFDPKTGDCDVCELPLREEITALAPARTGDRGVYAVGYKNGSLLVYRMRPKARPKPQADWLHNLSASSPIQGMSWHASSPLLAVQDADGGLRIWHIRDKATERVVAERRGRERGLGWMGWSKHGRIVHYQTGKGNVWDVQNTVPTSCPIAAPNDVVGMAFCGPRAMFFILRDHNILQKYALDKDPSKPPSMIAEQKHPPVSAILPVSMEDRNAVSTLYPAQPSRLSVASVTSEAMSEITIMKGWQSDGEESEEDGTSRIFRRSTSTTRPSSEDSSISTCANVPKSFLPGMHDLLSTLSTVEPQKDTVADLFPGARRRMIRTRYPFPVPPQAAASLPQFRTQVLAIVFGWEYSVEDLVNDESAQAAPGDPRREFLTKWLNNTAPDADMHNKIQDAKKCAEECMQSGNVHGAVCTLLQVRLYDQAVGLYKNSGRYMEAVLVAFLYVPRWEYQISLLGAWACAEEHSSPQLARRCRFFTTEAAKPPTRRYWSNVGPKRELAEIQERAKIQPLHISTSCIDTTTAALSANPRTAIPPGGRNLFRTQTGQSIPQSAHPDTRANRLGMPRTVQTPIYQMTPSDRTPTLLSPVAYQRPGDGTLPERGRLLMGKWRNSIRSLSAKRSGGNTVQAPDTGDEGQSVMPGFI